MVTRRLMYSLLVVAVFGSSLAQAQDSSPSPIAAKIRQIIVSGSAEGLDAKARDAARADAIQQAVRQANEPFLASRSGVTVYRAVCQKIFAAAGNYVPQSREVGTSTENGRTVVQLEATVATEQFQHDWDETAAAIAREGNPRVVVAIQENPLADEQASEPVYDGTLQSKTEEYFISKGVQLMDRTQTARVSKRDLALANAKDDVASVAALGAKFDADVVIVGQAEARYTGPAVLGEATIHKYQVTLTVRAVQCDSARLLAVKSFTKSFTVTERLGGGPKALAKMAEEAAPQVLTAVVDAWRKQAQDGRALQLRVSPMDFEAYKKFKDELAQQQGIKSVNLREINESVAAVDVTWDGSAESLAEKLGTLAKTKLTVIEITANRIICKVVP